MTTTSTFQGMDEGGKPSSRVLRPPGGGSSNIFGGPEPAAASPSKPYKRSNLLGGDDCAPTQTPPSKAPEPPKNPVVAAEPPKESPKATSSGKGQGAYNPITGEAYNNTTQDKASSRGRQPPGGASSGIF